MNAEQKIEWLQKKVDATLAGLESDYPEGSLETPAYAYRMEVLADYVAQLNEARRELQKTLPERIRERVAKDFAAKYVDRVTQDMIDVAAGNRPGNAFEQAWLDRWFPCEEIR